MNIGASTSCYYPLETEKSLQRIIDLGYKKTEIFFNTISELEPSFVNEMKQNADDNGVQILSVHPFSSNLENNCIFGEYERRYDDFIDVYKSTCHAGALLGAKCVVIHGAYAVLKRPLPEEHYFERFKRLIEIGKQEGVMVCQENVVRFRSQSLDFLKRMRDYIGDDFKMVLDVKQAVRSGYDPCEVASEMKDSIVHLHLSDNDMANDKDCLPPGKGNFDFQKLFNIVEPKSAVIELYSLGYDMDEELKKSKEFFDKM